MNNILIRYDRGYCVPDWCDTSELIGDISFGMLNFGFGKVIKVGIMRLDGKKTHTFENKDPSNTCRAVAIALAILLLPLTLLLAGIGCIAYARSESREHMRLCHFANINKIEEPNGNLYTCTTKGLLLTL